MGKNKKKPGKYGTAIAPSTQQITLSNTDNSLSLVSINKTGDILEGNVNIILETEPSEEVVSSEIITTPELFPLPKFVSKNTIIDDMVYERMKRIAGFAKHDWPKWHKI